MRAVILAGGLGMRLRPYTAILPKPLVPIGDRPILELIVRRLAACGVAEIDVCIGHLGELIQLYFAQGRNLPDGVEMRWHWEDEPLGTAGALRTVPDLDATFIAMNGDVLTTIDYRALVEFHHEHDAALTIASRRKRVEIDLGVLESADGYLTGYHEKPRLDYTVSMGIYVYEPRVLKFLPEGLLQFPDLVRILLDAGERVASYETDEPWYDIGTFGEYERAVERYGETPELFGAPPPTRA